MKRILAVVSVALLIPALSYGAKNPADYPLKVHVLEQNWVSRNVHRMQFSGTGRGNIFDGDSVRAFDFVYDCSIGLKRTARNQPYLAKWKKADLKLEILVNEIGKKDKFEGCELRTTLHAGVYIRGRGGIAEMSQENFKLWKLRRPASQEISPSNRPKQLSKVSIVSTPEAAEIEIDGEFVGNTPSTLELEPGDHDVVVHKDGYKDFTKKLHSSSGEITISAQLTRE